MPWFFVMGITLVRAAGPRALADDLSTASRHLADGVGGALSLAPHGSCSAASRW